MSTGRRQDQACGNCGLVWTEKRVKDDHPGVGYAHVCPRCSAISNVGQKKLTELSAEADAQADA